MLKILIVFFFAQTIFAQEFEKERVIKEKKFVLKGSGWRTATWFKKKVYKAGLYVEEKDKATEVLLGDGEKIIEMHFVRDVGAEDSKKVWQHSLKSNCEEPCKVEFQEFIRDVKEIREGHKHVYHFLLNAVLVNQNGNEKKYEQKGLSRLLLSTWIGKEPPTEELKKSLLGRE